MNWLQKVAGIKGNRNPYIIAFCKYFNLIIAKLEEYNGCKNSKTSFSKFLYKSYGFYKRMLKAYIPYIHAKEFRMSAKLKSEITGTILPLIEIILKNKFVWQKCIALLQLLFLEEIQLVYFAIINEKFQ